MLAEFQSEICPTDSLAFKAVVTAMQFEDKFKNFGYARTIEQDIEHARSVCRNWQNEFDRDFSKSCDLPLLEFAPLAADIFITLIIIILLHFQTFTLYPICLLTLEGLALSFNLFSIVQSALVFPVLFIRCQKDLEM